MYVYNIAAAHDDDNNNGTQTSFRRTSIHETGMIEQCANETDGGDLLKKQTQIYL